RYEFTLRQAIGLAINAAHAAGQLPDGEIPGIHTGLSKLDEVLGGWHNSDLTIIGARPAMGKAQPMDARVLLANGEWKYMAAVRIGDSLASVDGAPSHVTGIFPQGKRKIMRIRFDDGREV